MSKFYTSAYQYGTKLLVRGKENGKSFSRKIDFRPTLYVTSKNNAPTQFKTLDGAFVAPINPGTMRDCREFIDRYEDVEGFKVYGNTSYVAQFISEEYPKVIPWDMEQIKVFALDIETATENGFPNIELANEEILLITVQDHTTKEVVTFGSRIVINHPDTKYILCNNEAHLLKEFMIFWQQNTPDIVTGWNTDFFDIPYLIRRMNLVIGETLTNKLSPWGLVNERNVIVRGNKEITYDIAGVTSLDYLQLYQKYTYTKQESYRLDYIAEQELSENKLVNPEENFKDFYTKHWDTFVKYNINDVVLVDKLEDKMRLIELHLTLAYTAKINYSDAFSPVKLWDAIIYNHLKDKDVVIPQRGSSGKSEQFAGAYVKDPIVGMHKWVASLDLNSLYPHLIMQYNMSPETLTDTRLDVDVELLLSGEFKMPYYPKDLAVTANGWCYRKDVRGFLPILMEEMYINRSKYKKKMLKVQQEYEVTKDAHLLKEISRLTNLQMAMKIALNSAYGALGNSWFRYFDLRMAEGITTSGQLSIRWMANKLNGLMNKTMKSTDVDYVIAIDTDSIYLSLETLVESTCSDKDTPEKIKYMDRVCEKILQPFIDKGYSELATYMNAYEQKMQMKREVLADKGIWTAKKRYILNVHNSEGVQYAEPKIKVVGLEMVKSSTPSVVRNKLKESLSVILHEDEAALHKFVSTYRKKFMELPISEIAFPRGVNGVKQYAGSPIYMKGTPIAVRGALLHNHHVRRLGLQKKYQPIRDGDKIKFIYVRTPNPFQEDVISFSGELPKEFGLHAFIDYDKMFNKVFIDALQIVIEPIGWKTEEQTSLESFFG